MKSLTVNLRGYAPDADPTIEGVLTDCTRVVPTLKGMKAAPSPVSAGITVLAGTCIGAVSIRKLDDTARMFAGTATALYEKSGTSWTDRSRGGGYSGSGTQRWRFAQFGNVTLASNGATTVQASTASVFADVSTAPQASIIETVNQFVFVFDTNDATYGDSPDRWWCCKLGDHTVWTPSIADQAATGRLLAGSGPILAGRKFGDEIIAYKKNSMYRGVYIGPPFVWSFTQIPGEVGALSQECVVNIGTPENPKHVFMGVDNFYLYDGSRPTPIGSEELKITVFASLQQNQYGACQAVHDRLNSRVYFYYPVADSFLPDHCVVYNYKTNRWGVDDRKIEAVVEYVGTGLTYTDLGTSYATYADLPEASYDSAFVSQGVPLPAIFDTTHELQTLTGTPTTSGFTTGDVGDDVSFLTLSRVRPRFLTKPSSATLTPFYRHNIGDNLTQGVATTLSSGGFDVLQDSRWHRFHIDFTGDWELPGFVAQFEDSGLE
jgi:hypothetical protein